MSNFYLELNVLDDSSDVTMVRNTVIEAKNKAILLDVMVSFTMNGYDFTITSDDDVYEIMEDYNLYTSC